MPTTSSITDPISNRDAIGSVDSADSILIVDATDGVVKKATISQLPSGSGVSDGDKGDVVVSSGGTVWTLDTVPIAKGGTGQTSATAAFDALAPTTTAGDTIYHNGTDNVRLAAGTRYFQGLKTGGTSAAPYWENEPVRIYKTAEQTVANNTLTNDTVLMLDTTIYGTGTYNLYLSAYLESVDAAADVQYGAGAASGTFSFYGTRQHSVVNATTNVFSTFASPTIAAQSLAATVTGLGRVEITARVVCTVAGVWYFKFSQVTTTPASPSKCLAGSFIEFMKVA